MNITILALTTIEKIYIAIFFVLLLKSTYFYFRYVRKKVSSSIENSKSIKKEVLSWINDEQSNQGDFELKKLTDYVYTKFSNVPRKQLDEIIDEALEDGLSEPCIIHGRKFYTLEKSI